MRWGKLVKAATAVFLFTQTSFAEGNFAVAPRVSTQGLGAELVFKASEHVNLRGGLYGFSISRDDRASGIDYDLKASLFSGGAYVDFFPFKGNMRLSAGALYNGNKVTGINKPSQSFKIGGHKYTAEEIGSLDGRVDFKSFSPYAGLGWGNPVSGDSRWKFLFDVGVMFHGSPKATLLANIPDSSPLNLDPALRAQFEQDLQEETADFQDDIADFKVYPVISFGLSYRF